MARKLVLYIAMSLDGYIARPDGSIDWLTAFEKSPSDPNSDYGYGEFLASIEIILLGRKTYDQILNFGEFPYPHHICYVFSREFHANTEHVEFITEDPVNFVQNLLTQDGKDIWLVGGAEIIRIFKKENLIDEYILSIIPIFLGTGIPLFLPTTNEVSLVLANSTAYSNGIVQVMYRRGN